MSHPTPRLVLLGATATLMFAACADHSPTAPDEGFVPPTMAAALIPSSLATCSVRQITTDGGDQVSPDVSGGMIVWQDRRNGGDDIYGYDLSTGQEIPLAVAAAAQTDPSISGGLVVWNDARHAVSSGRDVYLLDLGTGQEQRVTSAPTAFGEPDISGAVVVWRDLGGPTHDIRGYDLAIGENLVVTQGFGTEDEPVVSGPYIAWTDYRDGHADVYAKNEWTGQVFAVATRPGDQMEPAIWGDVVVYTDYENGPGDIHAYDLSSGQDTNLTNTPVDEAWADIADGTVAFERRDAFGIAEIIALDLATGVETQITNDAVQQHTPRVSGNVIAWQDKRNGNADIYARVCDSAPVDPVGAIEALIERVEGLGPDGEGTLNKGITRGLVRNLEQALRLLERGKLGDAVDALLGFRQQVLDLEADGELGSSDGAALVAAVDAILAALGSG